MRKYNYRAEKFQQVEWAKLRGQVVGDERLVLAIDVAKTDFFMALIKADRTVLKTIRWSHPQETRALLEQLSSLGAGKLEAVLEPTGTYGDALRYQLRTLGVRIYRVSPKRVHDAAEVFDGVPSMHDAKAAYLIGRLHLDGISQPWREPDERRRSLRAELTCLELAQERYRRTLNRLEAHLARHWPEAPYWVSLQSVSLLQLLAEYGDPALVAVDSERADQLLREVGGHWLKREKREGLLHSATQTVGLPMLAAERQLIQELAQEILSARERSRQLERQLSQGVSENPGLTRMAQVVGKTSAVVLYCALGCASDYANAASYLKAAGLNLKERSSGKHQGKLKLTKRGPGVARYYLYFAVLRLVSRPGPARDWYQAKLARSGGPKGKLLIALVRKLAKALWHVGQGSQFDPAKLFDSRPQAQAA